MIKKKKIDNNNNNKVYVMKRRHTVGHFVRKLFCWKLSNDRIRTLEDSFTTSHLDDIYSLQQAPKLNHPSGHGCFQHRDYTTANTKTSFLSSFHDFRFLLPNIPLCNLVILQLHRLWSEQRSNILRERCFCFSGSSHPTNQKPSECCNEL